MAHIPEHPPDQDRHGLPADAIDRLTGPFERFMHVSASGGIVLLVCTVFALAAANSPWSDAYLGIWKTKLSIGVGDFQMSHSLKHWINDALMAVFFFVVGLEVKREIVLGELRELRKAALPIAGALGGMLVPAGIYLALQLGEPGERGWGIPMATDIAFVVGCMAMLGDRVPLGLRVMLLSLAIVDDIGAILVIAIGYTSNLDVEALLWGIAGVGVVALFSRIGVRSFLIYTILGAWIWLSFHESGVHATIAGVILGMMTPATSRVSLQFFRQALTEAQDVTQTGVWDRMTSRAADVVGFQRATRELISPVEYLEHLLHGWVSFLIMPVFALANAGVVFTVNDLVHPVATAVMAGLLIGKPLGIVLVSFLAVRLGLASLPDGVTWAVLAAGGILAGIGFTMALFIAGLALTGPGLDAAKMGVLFGSALAAVGGLGALGMALPRASRG